jgi:cytochrome P450
VDEFLRFESSNQLGNRRALRATQVGGVDLPEGALVTLCIGAANRDPAVYDAPETLTCSARATGTWPSASASTSARA